MDADVDARLRRLEHEVARLRAENDDLREALGRTTRDRAPAAPAPDPSSEPVTRRRVLGRGGAALVGGAVGGGLLLSGTGAPAGAANGDPLLLGQVNSASSGTSLDGSGVDAVLALGASGPTARVLEVDGAGALGEAVLIQGGGGVAPVARITRSGSGDVLVAEGGLGSSGVAITGGSFSGTGVLAGTLSSSNPALDARNAGGGTAVEATSVGIGVHATGDRAPLRLHPRDVDGPPTTAGHEVGEVVVGSDGALHVCVAGGQTPIWRRLAAVAAGFDPGAADGAGGSINVLAVPFRLFDSRPAQSAPSGGGGPLVPSVNVDVAVSGVEPSGATGVPVGAAAVLCTLTVTATEGAGGFLKAFPTGPAVPGTSVVNWFGAGQSLAATTIVGLSATGSMTLRAGSNRTHAIVDVIGFVA